MTDNEIRAAAAKRADAFYSKLPKKRWHLPRKVAVFIFIVLLIVGVVAWVSFNAQLSAGDQALCAAIGCK